MLCSDRVVELSETVLSCGKEDEAEATEVVVEIVGLVEDFC